MVTQNKIILNIVKKTAFIRATYSLDLFKESLKPNSYKKLGNQQLTATHEDDGS